MFAVNNPLYRPFTTSGVLHEQHRAWQQAVHQESAKQDRRRIGAGNAEAEKRNQRRAGHGVVRGLRRGNALRRPVAELLFVARPAPCLVVGQERRHRAAAARHTAFERADDGANQLRLAMRRHMAGRGNRMRAGSSTACHPGSPVCTRSSPIANSPTMTRIGAMPDSSSGLSKVNRVNPVTGSVPTPVASRRLPTGR